MPEQKPLKKEREPQLPRPEISPLQTDDVLPPIIRQVPDPPVPNRAHTEM